MTAQSGHRQMTKTVYLNIGSNRGDRLGFIGQAAALVSAAWPQATLRQSPPVFTAPWGYDSDATFANVGVALDFDGPLPDPFKLLETLQAIEKQVSPHSAHRNGDGTYRDRDIDIDIIDIDGMTLDTPTLTIPHPRAEARTFVTGPMQFLCPGWSAARGRAHRKKTTAELHRTDVAGFKAMQKKPIAVVLDNIRSLNNIGSIFRTADAYGVALVALCGITAVPPSPQIHKTALGAEESVDWQYFEDTLQAVRHLQSQGWTVLCLEQVHGAVPLQDLRLGPGQKTAIVVGNEVNGVQQAVADAADGCVEIPQCGTKHSLNVAVSAATAMWQLFSQLQSTHST